jgi:hypothetical protein
MIEAAGGVVWRTTRKGQLEILVVHRPRQCDWSLPKELPEAFYEDRQGRPKRVSYWAMQQVAGQFRRNREVDELRWVRFDRAGEVLTYERDVVVVAGLQVVFSAVA